VKYDPIVIALLGEFCKISAGLWLRSVSVVSGDVMDVYSRGMVPIKL
jgi:hypothetical protein